MMPENSEAISKTIRYIYFYTLKRRYKLKQKKNIIYAYESSDRIHGWKMWIKYFMFRRRFLRYMFILWPVGGKLARVRWDWMPWTFFPFRAVIKPSQYRLGEQPICKFYQCGENTEYGYSYCPRHIVECLCDCCHKRESKIGINNVKYCWECQHKV